MSHQNAKLVKLQERNRSGFLSWLFAKFFVWFVSLPTQRNEHGFNQLSNSEAGQKDHYYTQRDSASLSEILASTQRSLPSGKVSFFQKGALVLR